MRISVFVSQFPLFSETFITRKVAALAEAGNDVTVVALSPPDQTGRNGSVELGKVTIRVVHLRSSGGLLLWRVMRRGFQVAAASAQSPADVAALWRLLRAEKRMGLRLYRFGEMVGLAGLQSDIYHFENGGIAAYFREMLGGYAAPAVLSFRGADLDIRPVVDEAYGSELRMVASNATRVHCVSEALARRAVEFAEPSKIFVNYPGVDTASFRVLDRSRRDPNLIVTVSRLHWKKGLLYGLEAVARLIVEFPHLQYLIVGEGSEEESLRFNASDLGIGNNVRFFGKASERDVREILGKAAVFMLPTISEGISNAVLEAMSMCVPVVTTDAGGMSEAVTDGQEGFVVPRRNAAALACQVGLLLRDPELARGMGERGRQRVERQFTLERQIQVFLKEYETILVRAGRTSDGW